MVEQLESLLKVWEEKARIIGSLLAVKIWILKNNFDKELRFTI